ncbi:UDP-2,4-diacetamido-2,4,6-trideoxy-beta-L-altropyranose hydrolase [Methylobacillus arboreus]|uniref:UDP-2,4-diacetamido-2,4, 6-trideoxy-beta-L-altropyranose hydrolase n=1 Tax=Methylobacillus arboreus TaxID=755170 RepID=UPI001E35EA48|nr:UDP-2,4-diacetamido-2,4,6-trideoxy-beta-L-altropyranose hydrolase [Methylobacillus arboreus]MCB5189972.1 UDP-2,4-diacetamido-2,4,6-trideoxy-beta-L-altropyranose hydrolase [Methylobacillus arboreus]
MRKKAIVLADCGELIGLGHLRRTLVLASALTDVGVECLIYTPFASGANIVREYGFKHYAWPENLELLPEADIIVTDSYRLPSDIQLVWKHLFKLIVAIDDVGDNASHVDVIINGNIYAELISYKNNINSKLLVGSEYSLIRPEFFGIGAGRVTNAVKRVLISFGGTDDGKYAFAIAKALLEREAELVIDLIVSPLYSELKNAYGIQHPRLSVHHNNPDMVQLMGMASLYIGAPGGTLIEAMAAQLPFVVVKIAENQSVVVDVLKRYNCPVFEEFEPKSIAIKAQNVLSQKLEPCPFVRKLSSDGAKNVARRLIGYLPN